MISPAARRFLSSCTASSPEGFAASFAEPLLLPLRATVASATTTITTSTAAIIVVVRSPPAGADDDDVATCITDDSDVVGVEANAVVLVVLAAELADDVGVVWVVVGVAGAMIVPDLNS